MWKPDYVAPCVAFLAHENNPESGAIFESGGGWFGKVKWTRSAGHFFDIDAGGGAGARHATSPFLRSGLSFLDRKDALNSNRYSDARDLGASGGEHPNEPVVAPACGDGANVGTITTEDELVDNARVVVKSSGERKVKGNLFLKQTNIHITEHKVRG